MTGGMGGGGHQEAPPAQYQEPIAPVQQQSQQPMICSNELNQFLECAKNYESDLSLCAGFNEALRQCKIQNGKSLDSQRLNTLAWSSSCLLYGTYVKKQIKCEFTYYFRGKFW